MGVDINWGLGQGNNALAMFQQGAQMGGQIRQQREQTEQRNALLDLRKQENEREQQTFAQGQEDRATKQQEAQRGKIVTMGKLLSRAKDPVSYAQSRAAAQQLGFDVASIPEQYDPNWVAQQSMIVQAYQDGGAEKFTETAREVMELGFDLNTPEGKNAYRQRLAAKDSKPFNVGPGEGRYDIDPTTGQPRTIIAPYGAPQGGGGNGGPPPGAVEDGYRFRGGNPADPSAWEPVGQGGPAAPAGAGFRP